MRPMRSNIEAEHETSQKIEAAPILKEAVPPFLRNRFAEMILRPHFNVGPDAPMADFVEEAMRHPVFELRESNSLQRN